MRTWAKMKKVLFVMVLMAAPKAISNLAQAQPNLSQAQRLCLQDCAAAMGTCQFPC